MFSPKYADVFFILPDKLKAEFNLQMQQNSD